MTRADDGSQAWYVAEGQRGQQLLDQGEVGQATEVFEAILALLPQLPTWPIAPTDGNGRIRGADAILRWLFTMHGEEALWYDPQPDDSQREQVLRASVGVRADIKCPEELGRRRAQARPRAPAGPRPVRAPG